MCKFCDKNPVIILREKPLCKSCFTKYFEKKVLKTIAKYKLIEKNEHIGIAVSSGKDSTTLLYILNKLQLKRSNFKITAIAIDEGIKTYRNLKNLEKYCKNNNINLKIYSFKKEFNLTLDQMMKKTKLKACTICGVLRRYLLNKKSNLLKLDKLATGHNLDDEAQSILMNQFRKNLRASAILGPLTGIKEHKKFVRRIKPLYFITEKEVMTYAYLKNLTEPYKECPYSINSYRNDLRDLLNNFEEKYPGTKNSIVNSFLEILPLLRAKYKDSEINYCRKCRQPTSKEICQACEIIKSIN